MWCKSESVPAAFFLHSGTVSRRIFNNSLEISRENFVIIYRRYLYRDIYIEIIIKTNEWKLFVG